MANHRLSEEYKKLKGTLNTTREKEYKKKYADKELKLLTTQNKIEIPETLKDRKAINYFALLTQSLQQIGVLSYADIPEIETICILLQKINQVQKAYLSLDPDNKLYDTMQKRYLSLVNKFDTLGNKFYISPAVRSKMHLEELSIREKELNISAKEIGGIERVLIKRK